MKKAGALMVSLIMIILLSVNTFAVSTEESREFLLSYGCEEEFLNNISDTMTEKIITLIEDDEVFDVVSETIKSNKPDDVSINTLSVYTKDALGNLSKKIVCVYWECDSRKPLIKEEECISAMWNNKVFTLEGDSFYAEDYRKEDISHSWSVSDTYTVLARAEQNRIEHWSTLKKSEKYAGGSIIFSLQPAVPAKAEDMNADFSYTNIIYSHQFELYKIAVPIILLSAVAVIAILTIKKKRNKT